MNIRKNIDYSEMYATLDWIMTAVMPQMELYCEIGKAVGQRREKDAAVAAAEYLSSHYPDIQGFSPRNLRRMWDFYRTYEEYPSLLTAALQTGWTQNVVILEADLPMELRGWYLKAVKRFGWSKAELMEKIKGNAYEVIVLVIEKEVCYIDEQEEALYHNKAGCLLSKGKIVWHLIHKVRYRMKSKRGCRRKRLIMSCPTFTVKRIVFMRC